MLTRRFAAGGRSIDRKAGSWRVDADNKVGSLREKC
jgi:hypothetical protein